MYQEGDFTSVHTRRSNMKLPQVVSSKTKVSEKRLTHPARFRVYVCEVTSRGYVYLAVCAHCLFYRAQFTNSLVCTHICCSSLVFFGENFRVSVSGNKETQIPPLMIKLCHFQRTPPHRCIIQIPPPTAANILQHIQLRMLAVKKVVTCVTFAEMYI